MERSLGIDKLKGPASIVRIANVLLLTIAFVAGASINSAIAAPDAVIDVIAVGDRPSGLAVDSPRNQVFVSNSNDHTVSVIDGLTHVVIDNIPVGQYPLGVGVNESTGRVYVANASSNTVTIIDAETRSVLGEIQVGFFPRSIGINEDSNRVYVANANSDDVYVIDGASNTVLDIVQVGNAPARLVVHRETGRIYVPNRNDSTVSVIDPVSHGVIAVIPVVEYPWVVKIDESTGRALVGSLNTAAMTVIDTGLNVVVDTIAFPEETAEIEVNESSNRLYVSQTDQYGTEFRGVLVLDLDTYAILDQIESTFGPTVLDTNLTSSIMYGALHNADSVVVFDVESAMVVDFDGLVVLVESLGLQRGIENSLVRKIEAAKHAYERCQSSRATTILSAVIREIQALAGKKIPEAEALQLLAAVSQLIEAVSAQPSCDVISEVS